MAITNLASSSSSTPPPFVALHLPSTPRLLPAFSPSILSRSTAPSAFRLRTRAMGTDLLGDFGARDPFPAELESQFGEKVLGNNDTEHKILIPNLSALSLAQQQCSPVSPLQPPMSEDDAKKLLKKRQWIDIYLAWQEYLRGALWSAWLDNVAIEPCLLHGDLWSGNICSDKNRELVILMPTKMNYAKA